MRSLLRFSLLLGLSLLVSCAPQEPIRIGFVGGLSGRVADLGIGGRNGATLAVEQRNQKGGISGRLVELITADDEQEAETAKRAVAGLITQQVKAIIGPMTSDMAMATAELANRAKLPMVSPTVTTNALSGRDDYFLRVVGSTRLYTQNSAKHLYTTKGLRRIAVVLDQRNATYTESWLADFTVAFESLGGKIVTRTNFYSNPELHFQGLANSALKSRPDGILLLANSVDAAMLCQKIRAINPNIPLATSEWGATERLIELGGKMVEGMVVSQLIDRESQAPAFLAFRQAYMKRFGQEPGFAGLTSYDATNLVLDALARQTAKQGLKETILAAPPFNGLQTQIKLDAFGDSNQNSFITEIRNGKFTPLK